MVLWWVPAGHIPTTDEARERLALLERDGPTPAAFTFRERFPAPGVTDGTSGQRSGNTRTSMGG